MRARPNRLHPLLFAIPACLIAACGTTERDEYVYVHSLTLTPTQVAPVDRLPPPIASRPFPDRMAALVSPGSLTDGDPISP